MSIISILLSLVRKIISMSIISILLPLVLLSLVSYYH